MEYGIKQLCGLAGVSARTLRYYDEIGLLKPLSISAAGYRLYGETQVDLLQQILFYRERGFGLQQIADILYNEEFDILSALQEHLLELEQRQRQTESLISAVKNTIASMKGAYNMSNQERFEALKQQAVRENEQKYGQEVRGRYGDEAADTANRTMLNMTEQQYTRFQELRQEILDSLARAVRAGENADSARAREIAKLHRTWLTMAWKEYTPQAHRSLVTMYAADPRFTAYYDSEAEGCAAFLEQAVLCWIAPERV